MSQLADVQTDVVDDFDHFLAQEAIWEGDGASSSTGDECFVIFTAFVLPSKTVPSSGSSFANPVRGLIDELQASQSTSAKIEKEIGRQARSVFEPRR